MIKSRHRKLSTSATGMLIALFMVAGIWPIYHGTIYAQESQKSDYLKLKERYFAAEIESGLILGDPAHSLGVGLGIVKNETFHMGLSLHFLINDARNQLPVGSEELTGLNLLGLNVQYRNHFSRKIGYLAAFSANIGAATYNRLRPDDVNTSNGFTIAGKPKVGLFYQFNRTTRMYTALKYMHGYIFRGTTSYRGLPMVSVGFRVSEVGF